LDENQPYVVVASGGVAWMEKNLSCSSFLKIESSLVYICLKFLQEFNFTIKYRKSEDHGNADFMSRLPTTSTELAKWDESNEPDPIEALQIYLPHWYMYTIAYSKCHKRRQHPCFQKKIISGKLRHCTEKRGTQIITYLLC